MDSMSNPGEESTDYTVYTSPGLSMPSTGYPSLLFCPACKARRLAQHESVLRPTKSSHKWPTWVWRSSSGVYSFSVISLVRLTFLERSVQLICHTEPS